MVDDGLPALPDEKSPVPSTAPAVDRRKGAIVRGIIISGWFITLLTMIAILGTALYLMLARDFAKLPEELAQWAGVALGFLFGTFTGIVRDYVNGTGP